ncbi:hypothetical protein OS493_008688 [Desmophyllum pertusum]|uniref:VWFA domain-containing protein n=1 Tax=Desmophyllum pertusum TaxID=174260 RepID=A0A9W9ZRK4_9CNID|nr:hypothetical protein OS493_008688 [Desmophyllum pertusum]
MASTCTKLPVMQQVIAPVAHHIPITTDIEFLLDGFSYVGPRNFNREKAFVQSIIRCITLKNQKLRIGVATYGSQAHAHLRFNQHCSLGQALQNINYIPFPDQAGRRVDRALKASLKYFFSGTIRRCFVRHLVVVISGRQTERSSVIFKRLRRLPWQFSRKGVQVYAVLVGKVGAVAREHLRRITYRKRNLYVVRSFKKLFSKVGAITLAIRQQMRKQQIYQHRRCLPDPRKGRGRADDKSKEW